MKSIGIILGNITNPSGTERAVANLTNILCALGYNVVIISLYSSGGKCYYPLAKGVKIIHSGFQVNPIHKRIMSYLRYPSFIKSVVRNEDLAAVLATGHQSNSLLVFVTGKVKKIGCEHMNYDAAPFYSKIFRRICYPLLDAVVCLTNGDAKRYKFIRRERLFVIPNSLSFDCETLSTCEAKRMIAAGRLTKQKGFDLLLDAAVLMKSELPDWHLDIFGEGEEKKELMHKILELNLGDFVSINKTTPNIKAEFIKSSIYVMSSRYEGLPMVLIEAQECGLPVVSFDCPNGPSDVIENGKTGYVVPLYDIKALAEKTVVLAKNEGMRKQFGREANIIATGKYSAVQITKMWKRVVEGNMVMGGQNYSCGQINVPKGVRFAD